MVFHLHPSTVIQGKLKAVVSLVVNNSVHLCTLKATFNPTGELRAALIYSMFCFTKPT